MNDMIKINVYKLPNSRVCFEVGAKVFIISEIEAEELCIKLENELFDDKTYSDLSKENLSLKSEIENLEKQLFWKEVSTNGKGNCLL